MIFINEDLILEELDKIYTSLDEIKKILFPNISEELPSYQKSDMEFTLMNISQYNTYKHLIPVINSWWWLSDCGNMSIFQAAVNQDGSIDSEGNNKLLLGAVRPVFCDKDVSFAPGDRVRVGNCVFVYLSDGYFISEKGLFFEMFDQNGSVWEDSYLHSIFQKSCRERIFSSKHVPDSCL